jgi:hypothetical protein
MISKEDRRLILLENRRRLAAEKAEKASKRTISWQNHITCLVDEFGRFNHSVPRLRLFNYYIESGKGLKINDMDTLIQKMEGEDMGFISAEERKEVLKRQEGADKLWDDLNEYPLGIITVLGSRVPRNSTGETACASQKKCLMVFNEGHHATSIAFANILFEIGEKYGQRSVLVKPSREIDFKGTDLKPEICYELEMTGGIKALGKVGKDTITKWHEDLTFSYAIKSMDFSDAMGLRRPMDAWSRSRKIRATNERYEQERKLY